METNPVYEAYQTLVDVLKNSNEYYKSQYELEKDRADKLEARVNDLLKMLSEADRKNFELSMKCISDENSYAC